MLEDAKAVPSRINICFLLTLKKPIVEYKYFFQISFKTIIIGVCMKILVTHDFLTTEVLIHTRLSSFLSPILQYLKCDISFLSPEHAAILEEKLNLSRSGKMFSYVNDAKLPQSTIKSIVDFLNEYDFIIIFEASNAFKNILNNSGIKYLDIWLSPFRFTKDMIFSMCSNEPRIQRVLEEYKIQETELSHSATIVKNHANNFLKTPDIILEKKSALLIGQLFQDKSVMRNGQFLTLLDFKDQLKKLAKNYSRIYFLKHPLMTQDDFSKILEGLSGISNITYITGVNTYYLLSQPEICDVIGLSSSVLTEAEYFGKNSIYLFKPVLGPEFKTIYKEIYTTKFWRELLDISPTTDDIEFLTHDNYIRYSTGLYYAYSDFMNDSPDKREYKTITDLYKFCTELNKDKQYVIYGYGSLGKLILPLIKNNVIAIIDKALNNISYVDEIPVTSIEELPIGANVIITPFIYAQDIIAQLRHKECSFILPNAH